MARIKASSAESVPMTIQGPFKLPKPTCTTNKSLCASGSRVSNLPTSFWDEPVVFQLGNKSGDPVVITINCLDRVALACDVARTLLEFGLDVVQADFSTDGQWCFLLFWVLARTGLTDSIKWALLKKRLIAECPSPISSLYCGFSNLDACSEKKCYYLLQACAAERPGLLNDLSNGLWELELEVVKVKKLTSPDGHAVIVILVSDFRRGSADKRREVICDHVKCILGDCYSYCELTLATMDDLSEVLDLGMLLYGVPNELIEVDKADIVASPTDKVFSLGIDNSLSPSYTVLHITSRDRRGLLYDCMRALNDLNLKIAYGRLKAACSMGTVAFDLFVSQANGSKFLDVDKQNSLQARMRLDMCHPIRVMIVDKGPNIELFVATTVEKSGRTRPSIMHDVTLVLKTLQVGIFKAESEQLCNGERLWEMYRFLLVELPSSPLNLKADQMRSYIVERVTNGLSG